MTDAITLLERAKAEFKRNGLCRFHYAESDTGEAVHCLSPEAASRCMTGALEVATWGEHEQAAREPDLTYCELGIDLSSPEASYRMDAGDEAIGALRAVAPQHFGERYRSMAETYGLAYPPEPDQVIGVAPINDRILDSAQDAIDWIDAALAHLRERKGD